MKKALLSASLMLVILFTGCTKDTPVDESAPYDPYYNGVINGIVKDGNTNVPLANVKVSYGDAKNTKENTTVSQFVYTDANGIFVIPNLTQGDYSLSINTGDPNNEAIANYASIVVGGGKATLPAPPQYYVTNKLLFTTYVDVDMDLYKKNANATGYIYGTNNNVNVTKEGIVVKITMPTDKNIVPAYYTTTTDATGKFTFNNLPSVGAAKIVALPWVDANNIAYKPAAEQTVGLNENVTTDMHKLDNSTKDQTPTLIVGSSFAGLKDFQIQTGNAPTTLTVTFSKPMKKVDLSFTAPNNANVVMNKSWDASKTVLTITTSGYLQLGTPYKLKVTGTPEDYSTFTDAELEFTTQDGLKLLSTSVDPYLDGQVRDNVPVSGSIIVNFNITIDPTTIAYTGNNITITGTGTLMDKITGTSANGTVLTVNYSGLTAGNIDGALVINGVKSSLPGDGGVTKTISFKTVKN